MYTHGHERTRIESANQMRLHNRNNTHGVTALDAACGLSMNMVASNKQPLPVHFRISHWLCVMARWVVELVAV